MRCRKLEHRCTVLSRSWTFDDTSISLDQQMHWLFLGSAAHFRATLLHTHVSTEPASKIAAICTACGPAGHCLALRGSRTLDRLPSVTTVFRTVAILWPPGQSSPGSRTCEATPGCPWTYEPNCGACVSRCGIHQLKFSVFSLDQAVWANYNNSLTWNKAMLGWFLLLTMIPVRSQWGRYNLPRYVLARAYKLENTYRGFHSPPSIMRYPHLWKPP